MRNKEKAMDILNDVFKEELPSSTDPDDEMDRIAQLENSIMEKLEKRIDEKLESYKQSVVDNVDNNDTDSNIENNDNMEVSENGDN